MSEPGLPNLTSDPAPWDARLARRLIGPLRHTRVTPNHLTSLRLLCGIASAVCFLPASYGWSNLGALLLVISNFLDHTDGELARITGQSSRLGHYYDIASDAAVTIMLFVAMGVGIGRHGAGPLPLPAALLGLLAGSAIASIFYLRMRIEERVGKVASRQASMVGFETEDVLYLLPVVTVCDGVRPFLIAAAIGAPLFALWVLTAYLRIFRQRRIPVRSTSGVA